MSSSTDAQPAPLDAGAPRPLAWFLGALLAVVATILYAPGLEGEFLYDDFALVEEAPATRSVGAAFENFFEPTFRFGVDEGLAVRGIWRPLMSLALAAGNAAGGGEPFAHHALSLALHVLAALALVRWLALLLRTRAGLTGTAAEVAAAAAALVFVVHPANVEAVAWASAINDPLWAALGFTALHRYEHARLAGKLPIAAAVLILAALLAKESALVLPALCLLLDWSGGRLRGAAGALRCAAPLALPVAAWLGARAWVFGSASAGLFESAGTFALPGFAREASLRLELFGGFIGNALWPNDPRFFRPVHPVLPEGSGALASAGAWSLGFVAAAVALVLRRRWSAAACLAGFACVILPFVIAPDRAGLYPLSDRYLYGALGPLLAGLALAFARIGRGVPFAALGVCAAVPLFAIARAELPAFANWIAFQDQAVLDAPDSPNIRWATGNAHLKEYLRTEDIEELRAAYVHHLISLRLGSTYGDEAELHDESVPYVNRIPALVASIDGADPLELKENPTVLWTVEDRYRATLGQIHCEILREGLKPRDERDLTLVLERIDQAKRVWERTIGYAERDDFSSLRAQVLQRLGKLGEARTEIARALESGGVPRAQEYIELSKVQLGEGDAEGARDSLERAAKLRPDDPVLQLRLSIAADATGRGELAVAAAERAHELTGGKDANVLVQLSVVELGRGRPTKALEWIDRALEVDPGLGAAFKQRALVYTLLGDADRALSDWQEAARALTEDFVVHYNLAAMLLAQEPPADVPDGVREGWRDAFLGAAIRAYILAPPQGAEQLQLQVQIETHLGEEPSAMLEIISVLKSQGRELLAFHWLKRVTELEDKLPAARRRAVMPLVWTELGRGYARAERFRDAEDAFRSAHEVDPTHFPAALDLGMLLYEQGRPGEALPFLESAQRLLPDSRVVPDMRAAVEVTLKERIKAVREGTAPVGPPDKPTSSPETPNGG